MYLLTEKTGTPLWIIYFNLLQPLDVTDFCLLLMADCKPEISEPYMLAPVYYDKFSKFILQSSCMHLQKKWR